MTLKRYGVYPRFDLIVWVRDNDSPDGIVDKLFDDYYDEEEARKALENFDFASHLDVAVAEVYKVTRADLERIDYKSTPVEFHWDDDDDEMQNPVDMDDEDYFDDEMDFD